MEPQGYKIVTLGQGRVGKTSLTLKFVNNQFDQHEVSTINANFLTKLIQVHSTPIQLNIWDTAGQERFKALTPIYYKQAKGAILVYDITDKQTFQRVKSWVTQLRTHADSDICIVIAGNKCDKQQERNIRKQEALQYASEIRIAHFSTSAKTGKGVGECFNEIARLVHQTQTAGMREKQEQQRKKGISRNKRGVQLQAAPETSNSKKGCC